MNPFLMLPLKRMSCKMQMTEEKTLFEYTGYKKEDFSVCLGCKICASVCTVNDIGLNINPQEVLLTLLLDKKLDDHPLIACCTNCYRCTEACPWNIRVPEVIRALRAHYRIETLFEKAFKSSLRLFGRVYEPYVIAMTWPKLLKEGYLKYLLKWIEYASVHLPHRVREK